MPMQEQLHEHAISLWTLRTDARTNRDGCNYCHMPDCARLSFRVICPLWWACRLAEVKVAKEDVPVTTVSWPRGCGVTEKGDVACMRVLLEVSRRRSALNDLDKATVLQLEARETPAAAVGPDIAGVAAR
jgi:hypothetical protein